MNHYCIYTRDMRTSPGVFGALQELDIHYEVHVNRTRFWLDPHSKSHMQLYIRYSHVLHDITHETNHGLGV